MRNAVLIAIAGLVLVLVLAAVGPLLIPAATYQRVVEESLTSALDARVELESFRFRIIPYPGYTIRNLALYATKPPFQGMPLVKARTITGTLSFPALLAGRVDTAIVVSDVDVDVRMAGGVTNLGMILGLEAAPEGTIFPATGGPAALPGPAVTPPAGPVLAEPQLQVIPSMAAPSIEVQPEQGPAGEVVQPGQPGVAVPAVPPQPEPQPQPQPQPAAPTPMAPSLPLPQPQPEARPPASELLRELILRTARAAADDDAAEAELEPRDVILRSIDVVRGRITITPEGDALPLVLDNVSIAAVNLHPETGLAADVRLSAAIAGSPQPNLGLTGQAVLDQGRREFVARGMRLSLNGAQFAVELLFNYGLDPAAIDLHVATPDLTSRAFEPILSLVGGKLPFSLGWQGAIGADVTFRGTRGSAEVALQFDGTAARVTGSSLFSKEAGIPFKVQAQLSMRPAAWTIGSCTIGFGDDTIAVAGEVMRDPAQLARLSLSGRGLKLPTLRAFFPWLASMDALEGVDAEASIEGPVAAETPMALAGKFAATKAEMAGVALANASGAFAREGGGFAFSALRGTYAGGQLSGNGTVGIGEPLKLAFDAVIDGIETAEIPSLHGLLSGKASVVARAVSEGADGLTLARNLVLSGSLVVASGRLVAADGAAGAFSAATWRAIEELGKAAPDEAATRKLAAASGEVQELRAAFEIKQEAITVSEVGWHQPLYKAQLAAAVEPAGRLTGTGLLRIPREVAMELVRDPAAQKLLLERDGTLLIPVSAEGTIAAPHFTVDRVKFNEQVEQLARAAPPEPAAPAAPAGKQKAPLAKPAAAPPAEKPAAKAAAPTPAAAQPAPAQASAAPAQPAPVQEKPAKKKPAPESGAPEAEKPVKKKPATSPSLPEQAEEDILKVIIGQ